MTSEEKLYNLYECVINNSVLFTRVLNENGLNSKDIAKLIDNGYIERVKRGEYSFKDIDGLYRYGYKLISQKRYDDATKCFEKCFSLNQHLGACFQLFYRSIKSKDYEKAFELVDYLLKSNNDYYINDLKYYLYMLSIISDIPEKYKKYIKDISINDIKVSANDKRYNDSSALNKVRIAVLDRKFPYALNLSKYIDKRDYYTLQNLVSGNLIKQAAIEESNSKNKVLDLVKSKKYEELLEYLNDKKEKRGLSFLEEGILLICEDILNITKTGEVPISTSSTVFSVFDAIKAKNYLLALNLNVSHDEQINKYNDNSALHLLLININDLIKNIDKIRKEKIELLYLSFVSNLANNSYEEAMKDLDVYLRFVDKIKYKPLILDLIRLGDVRKDNKYSEVINSVKAIGNNEYQFDLNSINNRFFDAVYNERYDEARIYIDIINDVNVDDRIGQRLTQILNALERKNVVVFPETSEVHEESDSVVEENNVHEEKIIPVVRESVKRSPSVENKKVVKSTMSDNKQLESDRAYLKEKYDEILKTKGIIILKPMSEERTLQLFLVIRKFPNMREFVIPNGDKKQIVLKYYSPCEEMSIGELNKKGQSAYSKKDYNEAIRIYTLLLHTVSKPKCELFVKLGLSYLKASRIYEAIDYLTVANSLSIKEGLDFDFTDLINNLKGKKSNVNNGNNKYDLKPKFTMSYREFDNNGTTDMYGIDFENINAYIEGSNLSVESALTAINMGIEDINKVKLIYAREYYIKGEMERGDMFLKSVIRCKDKSETVKKIIAEIEKNRKFYQYRENVEVKQLKLLRPHN